MLNCCEARRALKGLRVVKPPGPKEGAMLQRQQQPSEARNESWLTRKDIHGITMVVSKYDKISQGYLDLC